MKRRQEAKSVDKKKPTRKLKRSKEPQQRNNVAAAVGAPAGAAAVVAGRHLEVSTAGNALAHEPTNGLAHEAANTLAHHATDGVATEVVAAATGAGVAMVAGTSVGAGSAGAGAAGVAAGTAAAGAGSLAAGGAGGAAAAGTAAGAGAAAGGSAAGGAAAAGAQGAQATMAVGAVATVAVATVVVVVVATGEEPEVAEPAPTTTTTAAPEPELAVPVPGPGLFETTFDSGSLDGDVLAGVDQNTEAGSLMIVGLQGQPTNVGVPITLNSGATLTLDPLGAFQYVPAPSTAALPAGETIVDSFTYTVTNVDGFIEDWTAQVTVVGENQPPTIEDIGVSVVEGTTSTTPLDATDVDDDALSFALGDDAPSFVSLLTAEGGAAQLDVAPGGGSAGSYEFAVTVADSAQPPQTASATVQLTVVAPEAPARVTANLLARYDFNEAEGATVGERSGAELVPALTVADPSAISWADGGLTISQPTTLTAGSVSGLVETIKTSGAFTVEAWVTPANTTQGGPARIVSISNGTGQRNVTLAQGAADADGGGGDHWSSRQRTTETSTNGLPGLAAPSGTAVAGQRSHVVLTRSSDGQVRLYVDAVEVASETAAGDLSNWDSSFSLVVANETSGDRPWLGTLHLMAIYGKALSGAEVTRNYDVGVG